MIAIILVNWNGCGDTIECLESLMRLDDENFVVIVVDNGSGDGSLEAIEAWAEAPETRPTDEPWLRLPDDRKHKPCVERRDPQSPAQPFRPASVVLAPTGKNLGFAGANNVAMRMARSDEAVRGFWILNNDTVVTHDSLTQLRKVACERPDAGLIGARLHYYHSPDIVQGVGGFFLNFKARGGHIGHGLKPEALPPLAQIEARTSYVMGASMFLTVETYDLIGPMAEDYFLYFEEIDWAARLPCNLRQTVALDAVVYHKEGGSIGTSSIHRPSDTSLYYLHRNLLCYMRRRRPAFFPLALARVIREMIGWRARGDQAAARVIRVAVEDFLRGRTGRRQDKTAVERASGIGGFVGRRPRL